MKIIKRLISLAVCAAIAFGSICSYAYAYPSAFWSANKSYEAALNSKDYAGIIRYGNQILDIMAQAADGYEKQNITVTRYHQIGLAYAALGDYANSAAVFGKLCDYASKYGDQYYDYIRNAEARVEQYTSDIAIYTDGGTSVYYGAKNEKQNGVLYGICANGGTASKLDGESMVLTYQELGQELLAYNISVVKKASSSGVAVEFALNCPKEGTDIRNIRNMEPYLKELSELFKKYPKVPVYLRFAAEFDIWDSKAEPEEFVAAFRYVSDYFSNRNSNVAMVWSPNQAPDWYVDADDYYPGDEYVDWVGISLYAQKYFIGGSGDKEVNTIVFRAGVNSDPVVAVKDIVETYGDRKPIMISESGCGHKLMKSGENTSEFALRRLKEYLCYLPMVYPQIKLIAYFDWYVESTSEKNDFRLSTNTALQNEYLELVKNPRFIQDKYANTTDYCYRKVTDGAKLESTFEVACYAHLYNAETKSVTYFIDGKYVGMSNEVPFSTYIDAGAYSGKHTLKAVAAFDNGKTLTTSSSVNISTAGSEITVEISGDEVGFDQQPILYNDRTMVPMRKIFEELGADVSWNGGTQTATGKKGDRTVIIAVGQKKMYVNNTAIELDTAPIIISGRTLVPVRAVAEGLGCDVEWNEKYRLVSITPKVFKWSDWGEDIPDYVDEDMYYIEERDEYRIRTREEEYYTSSRKLSYANYVDTEISYGTWGDWQDGYISSSSDLQVDTRTVSSPMRYHYVHYCTGNISDTSNRYRTWKSWWHDECDYHDLGWFDSPLPYSDDSTDDYAYYVDGTKYRCSNSCFRWYLVETTGGESTQYRSRPVYTEYVYWEWGSWSRWSDWDDDNPYREYSRYDGSIDVDERTVYRYKEKG